MAEKIRIEDIVERASVSVGTVDGVLYKRPNVSESAPKRVEKVLKEMNYQSNVYAGALAYNKSYTFYCLIPKHSSEACWEEIEIGAMKAVEARRDFYIDLEIMYHSRLDPHSFAETCQKCLRQNPDGVILAPTTLEVTRLFTNELHDRNIPFILLDSYVPSLQPLSFYGQDSIQSGRFAARMLVLIAQKEESIMLMKQTKDGKMASRQQENHEVGFRHYVEKNLPNTKILEINLPLGEERKCYDRISKRFSSECSEVHHCITLNSKAHIVGKFLLKTHRHNVQIMGYDVVHKNADCLREGSISSLVAQHAYQQGYLSVDSLLRAIVLKKKAEPVNYMPIDLLMRGNIDLYHRPWG